MVLGKDSSDDSSSEDDADLKAEIKATHKALRHEKKARDRHEAPMFELKDGEEFAGLRKQSRPNRAALGDRLVDASEPVRHAVREMRFSTRRPEKTRMKQREKDKKHQEERRKLVRSTAGLVKDKAKPKFWKGKRVQ